MTQSDARASRRRFLVLIAASRVLISARPLSSTAHSTGESCGRPSDLNVASTARWWACRNSRARSRSMPGVVEPDTPLPLVLVHDGACVAVGEPMLVGEPVGAFLTPEERRARFQPLEPLDQVASGYGRDARDQILMRLQGVVQCHEHLQGRRVLLLSLHHLHVPDNPLPLAFRNTGVSCSPP